MIDNRYTSDPINAIAGLMRIITSYNHNQTMRNPVILPIIRKLRKILFLGKIPNLWITITRKKMVRAYIAWIIRSGNKK